jgi:serine/threonine protein kinase
MAPEIVQKLEYAGPPADIWALGVLLFTLLSGCFPYRGATDKELYKKIMRADYKLPSEVLLSLSSEAVNLIKRPSARDILNDAWFQEKSDVSTCPSSIIRSHSYQPDLVKSHSDMVPES